MDHVIYLQSELLLLRDDLPGAMCEIQSPQQAIMYATGLNNRGEPLPVCSVMLNLNLRLGKINKAIGTSVGVFRSALKSAC